MVANTPEKTVEFVTTTPSGIEVRYQSEPKRKYDIRRNSDSIWFEVPSVTTVLGVLDKPALPWWGMGVGMEAVIALHNLGLLKSFRHAEQDVFACQNEDGQWEIAGKEQIIALATKHKLTVNHVRDRAGDRGNAVHDALEVWATTGALPDPSIYPPQEMGYVAGLVTFLEHAMPEPVASEVMVGSLEHGFAGRYDLDFKTDEDRPVVVHRTPVGGAWWATLPAGFYRLDLKTSSGVYPTHAKQLEGYELAAIECGYEPSDGRGILHVGADGTYEFVRSWATGADFLTTLAEWRSQKAMNERRKQK